MINIFVRLATFLYICFMNHTYFTSENTLSGEEWRQVIGYESLFLVSNFGRVASKDRVVICKKSTGLTRISKGKILRTYLNEKGYACVNLNIGSGKIKNARVHRLVCMAFHPNPENKPEVNHKDFNKANNNVNNLEWSTGKENYIHAVRGGRNRPPREKQFNLRLSVTPEKGALSVYAKTFYKYDVNGYFICELKGLSEESRKVGSSSNAIQKSIKNGHAHKGFRYSFEKHEKLPIIKKPRIVPKKYKTKKQDVQLANT